MSRPIDPPRDEPITLREYLTWRTMRRTGCASYEALAAVDAVAAVRSELPWRERKTWDEWEREHEYV